MHFIENPNNFTCVGHIDGNNLNNDIKNLRWETKQQNGMKQKKKQGKTTSIYKGVTYVEETQRWRSIIQNEGKPQHLGYFDTELEAAKAYDIEAKKLFKEFARLNLEEDEHDKQKIIAQTNQQQNTQMQKQDIQMRKQNTNFSSIYRGVSFKKTSQKWRAEIRVDKKTKHLGLFKTELEATKARDEAAKELHGEFAILNLTEEQLANLNINEVKEQQ